MVFILFVVDPNSTTTRSSAFRRCVSFTSCELLEPELVVVLVLFPMLQSVGHDDDEPNSSSSWIFFATLQKAKPRRWLALARCRRGICFVCCKFELHDDDELDSTLSCFFLFTWASGTTTTMNQSLSSCWFFFQRYKAHATMTTNSICHHRGFLSSRELLEPPPHRHCGFLLFVCFWNHDDNELSLSSSGIFFPAL
jgi:hypothetical protein